MTETPYSQGTSLSFNALPNILRTYFPNPKNGGRDRSQELITEYQKVNGGGVKFEGLLDELKQVARDPNIATELFRSTLGGTPEPDQAVSYFADLHDALAQTGRFDPATIEAEEAAAKKAEAEAKPDTSELLDYYARRRINLPGVLSRFSAPLWVYLAVAGVTAAVSGILYALVPPSWGIGYTILTWPLRVLALASLAVAFVTGLTMSGLRRERLKPAAADDDGRRKSFWRFR